MSYRMKINLSFNRVYYVEEIKYIYIKKIVFIYLPLGKMSFLFMYKYNKW